MFFFGLVLAVEFLMVEDLVEWLTGVFGFRAGTVEAAGLEGDSARRREINSSRVILTAPAIFRRRAMSNNVSLLRVLSC